MYRRGDGVPQNYSEFVHWLTAAANQNVVPALMDLAKFYMHPLDDKAADVERAIHNYEKAADFGDIHAPAILGNIFANGLQEKPDYEQALKWYRRSAELGQRDGQYGLGVRHALGQGVPIDLGEAQRLFTAAADQGLAQAQYDLATMYDEGNGVPADPERAAHYYQLAAEQGMAKAQFHLDNCWRAARHQRAIESRHTNG